MAILKGGGLAAVINVAIYYLSISMGWIDTDLPVSPDGQPLTVAAMIIASILPAILGGVIYWLLVRYTKRPNPIFYILSAIVVIAFVFSPFSIQNVPTSMVVILEIAHLVVAAAVVYFLVQLNPGTQS